MALLEEALETADALLAEARLKAAADLAARSGDGTTHYRALDELARRRRVVEDNRVSLDLWLRAREAASAAQAPAEERVRLDALVAFNLISMGMADQAVEYAEAAYENALVLPAGSTRMQAMNALALTQTRLGHFASARATYRELVQEARQLPQARRELWRAHVNRGVCCAEEARHAEADPCRRDALLRRQLRLDAMAERLSANDGERLYTLCNDTEALALLGRTDEAEARLHQARECLSRQPAQDQSTRQLAAVVLHLGGLIEMQRGRLAKAAGLIAQGIAALEAMDALDDLPALLDRLSVAEEGCGHYREALAAVRRAARMRLDLARAQSATRLRMLEVRQGLQQARQWAEAERRRAHALELQRRALQDDAHRLAAVARTDPLTGLGNRRVLEEVSRELAFSEGEPLGLATLDLDHFKRVNDLHSHAVGDRVLVAVAELLRRICRPEDTLVRMGGEEFGVVLRRAGPDAAQRACERLRQAIADHDWHALSPGLQVTASIGLVTARTPVDAAALLARADALLYDAKHAGRDRVCIEPGP